MKLSFIALAFTLMTILSANASTASSFSPRHLKKITDAVAKKCYLVGNLQEVATHTRVDRVDQGIIDYYYKSEFLMEVRVDQGLFDTYKVNVDSAIFDAYDHADKDWGIITVDSVSCEMI
ncbi:MAG: hypothetical protein ACLGHN_06475 [Bacteriovoracia bacterium]